MLLLSVPGYLNILKVLQLYQKSNDKLVKCSNTVLTVPPSQVGGCAPL